MQNLSAPRPLRSLLATALLLGGLACAHGSNAIAGTATPAEDAWTPSAEETAVYQALSMRDAGPPCEEIEALAKDPVATLISVTEHATMPPWVGVRATRCLTTRHAEEAKSTLAAWMADPEKRGLAFLIADGLGDAPEPVALDLARAGLAGPHAASLQKRLAKSTWPSVAALANATPAAR